MKLNRIGLILIVSALAVIAIVVGLLVQRQQATHAAQTDVKGLGLARALAALPAATLTPGVLQALFPYHDDSDFAYASVTDAAGRTIGEVVAPGTIVPAGPLPAGATSGFGKRTLAGTPGRNIVEFHGPVADRANGVAFVRVGFRQGGYAMLGRDVSFFASLALMMFLLVPVIYLVIKREMAPLAALASQVPGLGDLPAARRDAHDIRDLADTLDAYLRTATARIAELEKNALNTVADNRLLQYGSKKLNAALQSMPDGLLMLDPGGEVSFATSKIEPLLGVGLEELLAQPVDSWCRDAALAHLLLRCRNGGSDTVRGRTVEFCPVNVPGKHLTATAQPLTAGQGAMAFGTLIVVRDVTREHLARQAGNDFVAHVSHELKSPLNVITMYAETLADTEEPELRVESLNVIQDEVERMNALVGNLLNVSKLETGSMSPERNRVRLDDLLRDAHDHALPRAEGRDLRVQLDIPRELAAVAVDKDLFRIALNNLLTNAIKYNRPGGSVTLAAREEHNEVVISVRDTGIGIAPDDQLRVFEKFYRASERGAQAPRGGHGLGLYLAAQIIELHHGRIVLDSVPGQGSTFSIHLKMAPAALEGTTVL